MLPVEGANGSVCGGDGGVGGCSGTNAGGDGGVGGCSGTNSESSGTSEKAKRHVQFCSDSYKHRSKCNRHFHHEQAWLARSWQLDCIKDIEKLPGVSRVRLDICQHGMVSHWDSKDGPLGPVLKPTGMLTNSPYLRRELSVRWPHDHEHVLLVGVRAAAARVSVRVMRRYMSWSCRTEESRHVPRMLYVSDV